MKLIAAVNNNWGIGKDNDLLYHISTDMKFFRSKTKDNVIIVGRKTLESFPGGNPLKNRVNIVLTRDINYTCDDAIIVHNINELLDKLNDYRNLEIYVCGGEEIYNLLCPYCDTAYITKIDDNLDAQKFFPNLDKMPDWKVTEESEELSENGYNFKFCTYINKSLK